jgi:type I restriction enzyme S subunit
LRTTNVQSSVEWDDLIYIPREFVKADAKLLRDGDILISMANSRELVGKVALVTCLPIEATLGGFIAAIRNTDVVNNRFLFYFLRSEAAQQRLRRAASQTVNIANLSLDGVYSSPIAVPPLAEQRRIVAAIEQQVTRLDAGVATLRRVQAALKRYRAAVLKAAVEGKLTEAWRAEHPDVEPASALLVRILAQRRARWETDLRAKGKDPSKAHYEEPALPGMEGLPELPTSWCWTCMGQSFEVRVGATPSRAEPNYWGGDIPWVSSGEVQFCRIHETREHITQAGLDNSSTQVNPAGSVLLGMIGEGRTRGQTAILDIDACNNQNCAAIWVSQTEVSPEFIYYWLWSQYEVTRRRGSGNNQPALNKARVEGMAFPLPPLSEQAEIVSEVERRLSVVAELEATVEVNLKRAERLGQSILERAFSGQLVPQDPNDEPASVLLARMRATLTEANRRTPFRGNGPSPAASPPNGQVPVAVVPPVSAQQGRLWDPDGQKERA